MQFEQLNRREFIAFIGGGAAAATAVAVATTMSYPDATNTGFRNAPGFPGSLTPWPGGAFVAGQTYRYFDFDNGTTGVSIDADNVTFIGCRFQCNDLTFYNMRANANNTTFSYCSFVPRLVLVTAPPVIAWPSAGAGQPVDASGGYAPYMINGNNGYKFGISMTAGKCTVDHCDIWGFGNAGWAINANNGTGPYIITNSWIHDACNPDQNLEHTDGVFNNSLTGQSNVTVRHNTIASIGNTNAIAFQRASTPYSFLTIDSNYVSGFGWNSNVGHNIVGNNNIQFTNNVFATDLRWVYGPLYNDYSAQFGHGSTNKWSGNKLKVLPGTSPGPQAQPPVWMPANDGRFIWPNVTLRTTDWNP